MDYFTPIKVGWIRPGYVGEITQLTTSITSMDTLVQYTPGSTKKLQAGKCPPNFASIFTRKESGKISSRRFIS